MPQPFIPAPVPQPGNPDSPQSGGGRVIDLPDGSQITLPPGGLDPDARATLGYLRQLLGQGQGVAGLGAGMQQVLQRLITQGIYRPAAGGVTPQGGGAGGFTPAGGGAAPPPVPGTGSGTPRSVPQGPVYAQSRVDPEALREMFAQAVARRRAAGWVPPMERNRRGAAGFVAGQPTVTPAPMPSPPITTGPVQTPPKPPKPTPGGDPFDPVDEDPRSQLPGKDRKRRLPQASYIP